MNNKVFYQHPNLMRVLGMHETVMEVMVNVLGTEKSQVMLQGEFNLNLTPGPGHVKWPLHRHVVGAHCLVILPREGTGVSTRPRRSMEMGPSQCESSHSSTGLLSLLPSLFCSPAPSKMEFLQVPLRSLICLVLCQKAVLKENRVLIMILALFPPECTCFLSEPSS